MLLPGVTPYRALKFRYEYGDYAQTCTEYISTIMPTSLGLGYQKANLLVEGGYRSGWLEGCHHNHEILGRDTAYSVYL